MCVGRTKCRQARPSNGDRSTGRKPTMGLKAVQSKAGLRATNTHLHYYVGYARLLRKAFSRRHHFDQKNLPIFTRTRARTVVQDKNSAQQQGVYLAPIQGLSRSECIRTARIGGYRRQQRPRGCSAFLRSAVLARVLVKPVRFLPLHLPPTFMPAVCAPPRNLARVCSHIQ